MEANSKKYTAFAIPGSGLWHYTRMPFGLCNAPRTFQRLIDSLFGPEFEPNIFGYLDDIIVATDTFEEHLQWLEVVLSKLREAGLSVNRKKCEFCCQRLTYLGFVLDAEGLRPDPERVAPVLNCKPPRNLKELRSFLGCISWYSRFIRMESSVKVPLLKLTKKNAPWLWGPEQSEAFESLKRALISSPVLARPDFSKPFKVQSDASAYAIGAVLTQDQDDGEHPIVYISRVLNAAERNYSTTERECLAVVWAIKKFRPYLEGYEFTVVTDHAALKSLQMAKEPAGRLARWALELQNWSFKIEHRKGVHMKIPDFLSRMPIQGEGEIAAFATIEDPWYISLVAEVEQTPQKFKKKWRVEDGLLYKFREDKLLDPIEDGIEGWRLAVPAEHRQRVLEDAHNEVTAGHLGLEKTYDRVARATSAVTSTMADGGPPDDQDICRCYTPGQTELDQSKAGAESPTNATGGIADNAARMVEDLAWQAETDEWWSTQLFSPQQKPLPPTREGTDVEDLIAWLATDSTPEWPILRQAPTTTPAAGTTATGANARTDRPLTLGETAEGKPSSVPQAKADAQSGEDTRARRKHDCAELKKLEEQALEQKAEARRLIRERKEAVEEEQKLRAEEEALRNSLQRLARQRAELGENLQTKTRKINLAIKHANYLDGEAADVRKYLAGQAQMGDTTQKPPQARSAPTASRPATTAQAHGAIRREPPSATAPRAPRANQPPPQQWPEKRYKQFSRVPHPGYLVALPGETPRGRYERILRLFEEIRTPAEDRQRVLRECFPDGTPRAEKDPNARNAVTEEKMNDWRARREALPTRRVMSEVSALLDCCEEPPADLSGEWLMDGVTTELAVWTEGRDQRDGLRRIFSKVRRLSNSGPERDGNRKRLGVYTPKPISRLASDLLISPTTFRTMALKGSAGGSSQQSRSADTSDITRRVGKASLRARQSTIDRETADLEDLDRKNQRTQLEEKSSRSAVSLSIVDWRARREALPTRRVMSEVSALLDCCEEPPADLSGEWLMDGVTTELAVWTEGRDQRDGLRRIFSKVRRLSNSGPERDGNRKRLGVYTPKPISRLASDLLISPTTFRTMALKGSAGGSSQQSRSADTSDITRRVGKASLRARQSTIDRETADLEDLDRKNQRTQLEEKSSRSAVSLSIVDWRARREALPTRRVMSEVSALLDCCEEPPADLSGEWLMDGVTTELAVWTEGRDQRDGLRRIFSKVRRLSNSGPERDGNRKRLGVYTPKPISRLASDLLISPTTFRTMALKGRTALDTLMSELSSAQEMVKTHFSNLLWKTLGGFDIYTNNTNYRHQYVTTHPNTFTPKKQISFQNVKLEPDVHGAVTVHVLRRATTGPNSNSPCSALPSKYFYSGTRPALPYITRSVHVSSIYLHIKRIDVLISCRIDNQLGGSRQDY
ncbi:unnamed protein product [Trichogramma brassicae]|uniref:RNA-directed DNA polymerase n=1 Tax=Trichogramma brassicae TaxID=86971 RepID=A0A6H5IP87_9HYME|nr:unnamed protein product [Trichogramma brassicae]